MNTNPDLSLAEWVKSTYSGNGGGSCVEWARSYVTSGTVPVRDSKDTSGPTLLFSGGGWGDFVSALKRGEFSV